MSSDSAGLSEEDKNRIRQAAASGDPGDLSPDEDRDARVETRERVLNAGEFERLLIGALRLDGDSGLEAWSACVIMGRLGLRAGEFCHLSSGWIDSRQRIISIPSHDPCEKGRGVVCGNCKQAIRQRQRNGDDRSFEAIAASYWQPKTEAAVRNVPYEWSARAEEAVMLLSDQHGGWPHSYTTLQRRLKNALERAPGLAPDNTTLHGLRGTAASFHAGNGVGKEALKQMMGWRGDRTPRKYLQIDGQMTKRALREVYR